MQVILTSTGVLGHAKDVTSSCQHVYKGMIHMGGYWLRLQISLDRSMGWFFVRKNHHESPACLASCLLDLRCSRGDDLLQYQATPKGMLNIIRPGLLRWVWHFTMHRDL
ncbi:hypothetical protein NC653_023225 [Populus alba x Populus x berolinensis]|uniref:Uncharacterized protein n=1 Tax=Populus alba x Populus x berolinensis TaxID=444605 RepID=A0AAD6MGM2_9ROSI|nr:hypothetical protein NC653_023225 [Populus alba x Populus x berolinensis]